jgi:hypothetical protein
VLLKIEIIKFKTKIQQMKKQNNKVIFVAIANTI